MGNYGCRNRIPLSENPDLPKVPWFEGIIIIILIIITILIIYPLTARVVRAPQVISQPVSSIFPVLYCPLGLGELQARPFPNVVFPPLPLFAFSSSPLHCALQDGFGQT